MSVSPDGSIVSAVDEQPRTTDAQGQTNIQEPLETAVSIFPELPKSLYQFFTDANLKHARVLVEAEQGKQVDEGDLAAAQTARSALDFDLRQLLKPPNLEWILEDNKWDVFGETWPIEEKLPSLSELGIKQLYEDSEDRRHSLQKLLHTLLITHTRIIASLLKPPLSRASLEIQAKGSDAGGNTPAPPELHSLTEHIRVTAVNMHHLLNELRPVQARENLLSLKRQEITRARANLERLKNQSATVQEMLHHLAKTYRENGSASNASSNAQPKDDSDILLSVTDSL